MLYYQGGVGQCAAGGDGTVLPVHHGELYHRPRRPLRDAVRLCVYSTDPSGGSLCHRGGRRGAVLLSVLLCHGVFPDWLPAFRASHLGGPDHGGGRHSVCGSPFQRRGLYAANSGSERLQPHGDLSAAESGIRVRHHFRCGDFGRPPQRAGIFRLRPDAGSGGAGTAAGQKKSISPACFFGSGACWLRFFRGHSQRYVLYFSLYEYGIHNRGEKYADRRIRRWF